MSRHSVVALLSLVGCLQAPSLAPIPPLPETGTRILFIGNSLTYQNDLPTVLGAVARSAGDTMHTRMVAFANFALEDHWNEGSAARALGGQRWDYVVMQQGPSSLPENQAHLATWSSRFAPLITTAGARPVLYQVWPARTRPQDFPGVKSAYQNAATGIGGLFAPAGEALRAALAETPELPVLDVDGFHPTALGTLLAAYVIYERVRGRPVTGLPVPPGFGGLTPALLSRIQSLAHDAVLSSP
ncbi:MAG: hypothetical protein IPK85_20360 [Gemmatimonadetes bacterium]|nr:hypothetical protein [Gemmatimonadota bacterium]